MVGEFPHPRNGSNVSGPQTMSGHLNKDIMYGVYILKGANGIGVRWDSIANTYLTISLTSVASNHLELPLFDPLDSHYVLSLLVDDRDHVFITGNHHDHLSGATTTHLIEYNPSAGAWDNPAAWSAASTAAWDPLDSEPGADPGTYTYHLFERLTNGIGLHFLSQSEFAGLAEGRDFLAFKIINGVWSPIVSDGHFATTVDGPADEADRAYIHAVYVEKDGGGTGIDRTWVSGHWRIDNTLASSIRDPWVLYSDDLSVWKYKASGGDGIQSMPITWFNRAGATVSSTPAVPSPYASLYVDPTTHYPAIIVVDQDTNETKRLAWTGTTWDSTLQLTEGGERRDILWRGSRWRRAQSSTRLVLRQGSTQICIGTGVQSLASVYSANHCPIWLRERDVYCVNVGDGDTPKFYTLGFGGRSMV